MAVMSKSSKVLLPFAFLAGAAPVALFAQASEQTQDRSLADVSATVHSADAPLTAGPEIRGIISARGPGRVQVTTADGAATQIAVNDDTRIKSSHGLFGLGSSKLAENALLNGLPVTVRTMQSEAGLVASRIDLQGKDMRTAAMIRGGTDQRFAEQTAATEGLRAHVADIGNYNVKSTTNVNFDTGRAALSPEAKQDLCAAATQAQSMNNAMILVVGYTDSTGGPEINQVLSEKRAGSVVNYLQQTCGWKPYRMLSPTGMSQADPVADNQTRGGKAQNRRVAVNVLVSKGLDGM